ncbi:hypothetical protein CBL_13708 [Carabus blaptoides fortunei]
MKRHRFSNKSTCPTARQDNMLSVSEFLLPALRHVVDFFNAMFPVLRVTASNSLHDLYEPKASGCANWRLRNPESDGWVMNEWNAGAHYSSLGLIPCSGFGAVSVASGVAAGCTFDRVAALRSVHMPVTLLPTIQCPV